MARNLTANFITEITKQGFAPILLIGAHFDSGDVYIWNGLGNLVYGGHTYVGTLPIMAIDKVDEQKSTVAAAVNITLSGLNASVAALADNEPYSERYLDISLALMDSTGAIISSPYQVFKGFMDTMRIVDDATNVTIVLTVENMLVRLERAIDSKNTPADQNVEFPNDTGFNFVTTIQNRNVVWG